MMDDNKKNPQNEIRQLMISESEKQNRYAVRSESETGDADFYKQVADLLAAARDFTKRQLDSVIITTY